MSGSQNIRFLTIGTLFSLVGGLVFFQMISIQNRPDMQKLKTESEQKHNTIDLTVIPERGWIYDSNGKMLAGSKEVYEIGIDLKSIKDKTANEETQAVAAAVSKVTGIEYAALLARTTVDRNTYWYMRLADGIDPAKAVELRKMKQEAFNQGKRDLQSLFLMAHLQRSYPEGTLSANILGYVTSLDPQNPRGVNGIEGRYNSYLAGTAVKVSLPASPYDIATLPNLPTGASLILTINREIQGSVEKILDKAVKDTTSVSGTAIVMDPRNGEILAMASTPRIDPNQYWLAKQELLMKNIPWNRAISQIYEPGSIFKPITMALAVEAGVVNRNTTYNDRGYFDAPGRRITNWNGQAYGVQTMIGCLEHSINTCLSWVVNQLGEKKFYEGIKAFGIGQPSNIDLDGENYYPVRLPGDPDWTLLSLANNAFGQGVAMAPIQIVSAISGIANGGKIMAPHILRAVVDNGRQYNNPPQVISQPVSTKTADEVSEMLAQAIDGESLHMKIDGYRFAGKTGTAEIPLPSGGYLSNKTNASFIGWGPVDDPRFLIYVWLEQPGGSQPFGSVVAAPVFKDIFLTSVQLTNLPPDSIRKQLMGKP
jgi:cell division protein FtsI/penicillin-binding protein 2